MGKGSRGDKVLRFLGIAVPIAVVVPLIAAFHWGQLGWRDRHENYPSRPSGYAQIVNRFGQPCNAEARAISMRWRAADNGVTYSFRLYNRHLPGTFRHRSGYRRLPGVTSEVTTVSRLPVD